MIKVKLHLDYILIKIKLNFDYKKITIRLTLRPHFLYRVLKSIRRFAPDFNTRYWLDEATFAKRTLNTNGL